ncbi:hypothetical protein KJ636_03980, partial [Patescibacteria group bacterium]|nr:hypothetical protein [Patescibacteria group bacterium]
ENTTVSGTHSFAAGINTTASGSWGNTAMGQNTTASGAVASTAMGYYTTASGWMSTAMGRYTTASGYASTAMGDVTTASGDRSTAIGKWATAGTAANTIVIGQGVDIDNRLVNNIASSLMVGFNSTIPTLFVGPSSGAGTTGNVGIGTTTPNHLLTVGKTGDATSTYALGVYGSIRATGAISSDQGFDIAERFPIDSQCQANNNCPETGDLVSIAENQIIQKSFIPYDSKLIGIISESPGLILSGGLDASSSRTVALAGRVPVKVSTENGEIKIGDALTSASSTPGVAMKATEPGRVIGMALEEMSNVKCQMSNQCQMINNQLIGKVMVFVNPHWSLGSLAEDGSLAGTESGIKNQGTGILDQFTLAIKRGLEKLGLLIQDGVAKVKELFAEKITTKQICLEGDDGEKICVTKDQLKALLNSSGSGAPISQPANIAQDSPPLVTEVTPTSTPATSTTTATTTASASTEATTTPATTESTSTEATTTQATTAEQTATSTEAATTTEQAQ